MNEPAPMILTLITCGLTLLSVALMVYNIVIIRVSERAMKRRR